MKLDRGVVQAAIVAGLPARARWVINGTPLDYDFTVASRGLRELPNDTVGSADEDWFNLLIFGEYDYAEGGGAHPWLGIHQANGFVYGLDPKRAVPMFLLNSSIERFIRTFRFLDESLSRGKQLPLDLEARVRELDPEAYPESDWRSLVDYLMSP